MKCAAEKSVRVGTAERGAVTASGGRLWAQNDRRGVGSPTIEVPAASSASGDVAEPPEEAEKACRLGDAPGARKRG